MKIAILTQDFPAPSETFVINHVVSLIDAGLDVTVIACSMSDAWGNIPEGLRERVRDRTILMDEALLTGWREAVRQLPSTGLLRRKLRNLVRRGEPVLGRYDVILAHFGHIGVRAMRLRDSGHIAGPIATIFHAYEISVQAMIETWLPRYRALFRNTEALLPISRFWARRLESWGADPAKIRVLHMGADLPAAPLDADRPLHSPLRVLQVGRLVEKKAARYSIEAVRQCRSPVRLELIGDGPLSDELRTLAASTQGSGDIVFCGPAPHADVLAALDEADVFLLPSITAGNGDVEGIPVALMEAMLHGCITVSTIHSGIPELIVDGVSGLLVPERSSAAIADALDAIAQGRHDLSAMRREAVAHVAREFNNAKLTGELIDILQRLARGQALRH